MDPLTQFHTHAHKIATRFILLDIGHLVIKGQHLVDINKVDIGDLVIKGQHLVVINTYSISHART